jgi:hypothetical protein
MTRDLTEALRIPAGSRWNICNKVGYALLNIDCVSIYKLTNQATMSVAGHVVRFTLRALFLKDNMKPWYKIPLI